MTGTFFGLNTALRGLEAQQLAMDVTSQNIANASTPGYSEQHAVLSTTDPQVQPGGAGELGTGVQVASITRAHDGFVQQQILYQTGVLQQQQAVSTAFSQVSAQFNDPSSQGFGTVLSTFFSAWQQLATTPTDSATRAVVVADGQALASAFTQTSTALQQQQGQQDQQIGGLVQQANTLVGQIGALNGQIAAAQAQQQAPNDLLDTRDTLVTQLAALLPISETTQANGTDAIALAGGGALVQGLATFSLTTMPDPAHSGATAVTFSGQHTPLAISGGQIGGAIAARDTAIGGTLTALDGLAGALAVAVNGYQSAGYGTDGSTGIPFFTGSSAATLAVNTAVVNNPAAIAAASAPNQPANNAVALQIAQLAEQPPPGGSATLQGQYAALIGQLGVKAQQAQSGVTTNTLVLQQLTNQQSSVSGVSLNQEAASLVQYQNAYAATARVISMINQAISDMITQLG